jgi:hypothetical protein
VVFGLASVLALSLAVPALGGPTSPVATISASAKKIANKALAAANQAQSTANTALSTAQSAQSSANTANTNANQAKTAAQAAQTSANNANTAATNANNNANTRIKDTTTVDGTATANDGTTPKNAAASCPTGEIITGGGYDIAGTDNDDEAVVTESTYGDEWFVIATEIQGSTPGNWSLTARAICGISGA